MSEQGMVLAAGHPPEPFPDGGMDEVKAVAGGDKRAKPPEAARTAKVRCEGHHVDVPSLRIFQCAWKVARAGHKPDVRPAVLLDELGDRLQLFPRVCGLCQRDDVF